MSFKKKIEDLILSRSNSYNFYKNHYEEYLLKKDLDPTIEMEFNQMKKDFDRFKKITDNQMNTMNQLMKTLFIDYELNNPRNALMHIQRLSNELLILFNNICQKNNISWWLNYGNLLGAIRHGYFVPWDDEVDIGMIRKDYLKFYRIINEELESFGLDDIVEVRFKTHEINDEKVQGYLQILVKNKNLINQGSDLYLSVLNIFPYDFIQENNKKTIKRNYKKSKSDFLNNLIDSGDFDFSLERYYDDLNLSFDKTGYLILGPEGVEFSNKVYIFETEKIFPLNQVLFGENNFNCPNDVHYYLKRLYKDYLNLPRVISIPKNVDKFRYNENNEEIFNESLNRLKEINQFMKRCYDER